MPESGEFLVRQQEAAAETRLHAAKPNRSKAKGCEPRFGEGSEGPSHLADAIGGVFMMVLRSRVNQTDVRLKEMTADFLAGGLQIVFAFMLAAGRGLQRYGVIPASSERQNEGRHGNATRQTRATSRDATVERAF